MNNELPTTLQEAIRHFSDDLTCIKFLADMRWENGVAICPRCQCDRTSFLTTRKLWKCLGCKKQFSIKVGTIFQDSAIKLDKWLAAMWMLATCKNGISSYEVHRAIGITQRSAWFVMHRLRTAMASGTFEKLGGVVEADESFLGGDAKNMHSDRRRRVVKKSGSMGHKKAVLGLVQRDGRAAARAVPKRDVYNIRKFVTHHVETGTNLITDQWGAYSNLRDLYRHEVIDHSVHYVRDNIIHTNSIENFWSNLKRTIKGSYISVSPEHLQKYIDEQLHRYNERKGDDLHRFLEAVKGIVGKRLTYSALIGDYLPSA